MADRGLSAEIIAELQKRQITLVHLLTFNFVGDPDYFADGRYDIVWNGNTYRASGDWLEIPQVKMSSAPSLDSISLKISGVNQANIYKVLTTNFTGVPVSIHRALLTYGLSATYPNSSLYPSSTAFPSSGASSGAMIILGEPIEIFSGLLDNPEVVEDPEAGTSEITWNASSYWSDFERVAGRRTNDADQQKWFPGDKGLEFASQSIAELKWGSV